MGDKYAETEFVTKAQYYRAQNKLWKAVLVMFGFLVLAVGTLAHSLSREGNLLRVEKLAQEGRDVDCANRRLLAGHILRMETILSENSDFGISREVILLELRDSKKQLATLNRLANCKGEE